MTPTKKTTATAAGPRTATAYRSEHQREVVNRLRRIEGQVRALV